MFTRIKSIVKFGETDELSSDTSKLILPCLRFLRSSRASISSGESGSPEILLADEVEIELNYDC